MNMHEYKSFGDNLKRIRKERNLTLEEMANLTGTIKQVLSHYERYERIPSVVMAIKIAKGLNVPITELIFDKDE